MYSRDPELALQFYREDDAEAELFTRPAPQGALARALLRLGGWLAQWRGRARRRG